MGTYCVMRAIDRGYPLAFLWLYVGAFVVAMTLMFVFPPGSLILMGLGLASLAVVVLLKKLLAIIVRWMARTALGEGSCPVCGYAIDTPAEEGSQWRCHSCATIFLASGAEESKPGALEHHGGRSP